MFGFQFLELDNLDDIWLQHFMTAVYEGVCHNALAYEIVPQTDILWCQVTEVGDYYKIAKCWQSVAYGYEKKATKSQWFCGLGVIRLEP